MTDPGSCHPRASRSTQPNIDAIFIVLSPTSEGAAAFTKLTGRSKGGATPDRQQISTGPAARRASMDALPENGKHPPQRPSGRVETNRDTTGRAAGSHCESLVATYGAVLPRRTPAQLTRRWRGNSWRGIHNDVHPTLLLPAGRPL